MPMLASWSHALFGNFLVGLRLIPALAMSATVALSAEFARAVGGGRFAQWLAGSCVLWDLVLARVCCSLPTSSSRSRGSPRMGAGAAREERGRALVASLRRRRRRQPQNQICDCVLCGGLGIGLLATPSGARSCARGFMWARNRRGDSVAECAVAAGAWLAISGARQGRRQW